MSDFQRTKEERRLRNLTSGAVFLAAILFVLGAVMLIRYCALSLPELSSEREDIVSFASLFADAAAPVIGVVAAAFVLRTLWLQQTQIQMQQEQFYKQIEAEDFLLDPSKIRLGECDIFDGGYASESILVPLRFVGDVSWIGSKQRAGSVLKIAGGNSFDGVTWQTFWRVDDDNYSARLYYCRRNGRNGCMKANIVFTSSENKPWLICERVALERELGGQS